MAITTLAELNSAITNWMGGRTDLTTFYPDWITLFEAYAARRLRVRPMVTFTTLTPASGFADLPTDYLGMLAVYHDSSPQTLLQNKSFEYLQTMVADQAGVPQFYAIVGNSILIYPQDTGALRVQYYAKNSAVSSTLNWLFNKYPDAYLFGALLEGANFTADTDQAIIWKSRRDEIMDEVSKLNFREPGGLSMANLSVTP